MKKIIIRKEIRIMLAVASLFALLFSALMLGLVISPRQTTRVGAQDNVHGQIIILQGGWTSVGVLTSTSGAFDFYDEYGQIAYWADGSHYRAWFGVNSDSILVSSLIAVRGIHTHYSTLWQEKQDIGYVILDERNVGLWGNGFSVDLLGYFPLFGEWTIGVFYYYQGELVGTSTLVIHTDVYMPIPNAPTGFKFMGWYLDEAFTMPFYLFPVQGNVTLHARFAPITYTITYHLNGGSMTNYPATFNIESNAITLPVPTRHGFEFDGWFTTPTFLGFAVTAIPQGTHVNQTFHARWTAIVYDITFNLNGGSFVAIAPSTFTIESPIIILPTPVRDGFTFDGWFGHETLAGISIIDIPSGSMGDIVFHARWTVITYNITYILNGGFFQTSPVSTFTIETATFTLPTPIRAGHDFQGWFESPYSGGLMEFPVTQVRQGSFGNIRLYARWTIQRFTVTFIVSGEVWQEIIVDWGTVLGQASLLDVATGSLVEVFLEPAMLTSFHLGNAIFDDMELFAPTSFNLMNSITFNVRGQQTTHWLPHNERLNNLFAPQMFGYEFVAWYFDEELTDQVRMTDRLTVNIELFARFEPIVPHEYSPTSWYRLWFFWVIAGLGLFAIVTIIVIIVMVKKKVD
ncbi:MAG: InlB B-repeat-containing protein [Firmicutes bacterium]|nr:InlB B-repeat-containing protein [Bacillota bacterium]